MFAPIKETLDLLSQALSSRPSDRATWESFTHTGTNLRQVVTEGAQGLLGQTALLDVEFSLGKLGPGDLKKVSGEVKSLIFQTKYVFNLWRFVLFNHVFSGLLSFLTFVQEGNKMDEKEEADLGRSASSQKDKRDGTATPDRLTWLRREIREHEIRHGHSLDSLVPILESVSVGLRSACDDVLRELIAWFDVCNSRRWRSLFFDLLGRGQTVEDFQRRHKELVMLLSRLEQEVKAFQEGRAKLIEPYKQFFDVETGKLKETTKHLPTTEKFTSR